MENQKFSYKLPTEKRKITTENNSLIIICANGSGKSKLGAWLERQDLENIHRVGAQRSLNFKEFIDLKSYEQAKNLLLENPPEDSINEDGVVF